MPLNNNDRAVLELVIILAFIVIMCVLFGTEFLFFIGFAVIIYLLF